MSVRGSAAAAVTIFHPAADPDGFDRWVSDLGASARTAEGFGSGSVSVHDGDLDWAMAVTFSSEDLLHRWLDSSQRQAVLEGVQLQGYWCRTTDLILGDGIEAAAGTSAFRHSVAAGKEAEFVRIQDRLALASSQFPGYGARCCCRPTAATSGCRCSGSGRRSSSRRGCGRASGTRHFLGSGRV